MVGRSDSGFMQQAAHLTGGTYLCPPRLAVLAQYLLVRILLYLLYPPNARAIASWVRLHTQWRSHPRLAAQNKFISALITT